MWEGTSVGNSSHSEQLPRVRTEAMAVYGTLRPGHGNHGWASDGVVDEILDGSISGAIYCVGPMGSYPVAKLDEPGRIAVDVLVFDTDSPEYESVCRMERGAGYELRQVEVELTDGTTMTAGVWHYLRPPRGPKVDSGDWNDR